MINKLSSLIMINFENLNLNRIFNNETKPILVYFLKNDIDKLIGKDEYEVNLHDIFSNGLRFRPYNDMLLVSCDEKECLLGTKGNKFVLYDKEFSVNKVEIFYDRVNNVYINDMYIENEEEAIHETQKIFLKKEQTEYEYQKTIVTKDGVIKYPNYSLLKDDKTDDLKLLSSEKGTKKHLIDVIEDPKIDNDILVYFENIFSILESKTLNEKKLSLRLNFANN